MRRGYDIVKRLERGEPVCFLQRELINGFQFDIDCVIRSDLFWLSVDQVRQIALFNGLDEDIRVRLQALRIHQEV